MFVDTACYGICLFSYDKLNSFLIDNKKSRIKRLLDFFEKNHDFYIQSLKNGVWIPISNIDSIKYKIKIIYNEKDMKNIKKNFYYNNFNLEVTDNSIWICDIGKLLNFDKKVFKEKDKFFYYTLDKNKITNGLKFSIPNGKYSVSIIGFMDNNIPCFSFKFDIVDDFLDFNDPRDDEKYSFSFS